MLGLALRRTYIIEANVSKLFKGYTIIDVKRRQVRSQFTQIQHAKFSIDSKQKSPDLDQNSTESKSENENMSSEEAKANFTGDKHQDAKSRKEDHNAVWKTAENIAFSTKQNILELNRAYEDIERKLMINLRESNQRRFRVFFMSILLGLLWIGSVFGKEIRKMLTDHTAGLAKETLENETIKIQTQELATAVLQTVLNDKDITMQVLIEE